MQKTAATIGIILALVLLIASDHFLTQAVLPVERTPPSPQLEQRDGQTQETETPPVLEKPHVLQIIDASPLEYRHQDDDNLLSKLVPSTEETQTVVLIKGGDRAGALTWISSSKASIFFLALKEALHSAFSPNLRDLVDETQRPSGRPIRNIFSFLDSTLGEERFLFVRIDEMLYEFHIAEGYDNDVFGLMDELTR